MCWHRRILVSSSNNKSWTTSRTSNSGSKLRRERRRYSARSKVLIQNLIALMNRCLNPPRIIRYNIMVGNMISRHVNNQNSSIVISTREFAKRWILLSCMKRKRWMRRGWRKNRICRSLKLSKRDSKMKLSPERLKVESTLVSVKAQFLYAPTPTTIQTVTPRTTLVLARTTFQIQC